MTFKDVLKQKIPADLQQTPEFPILLKLVERENISSELAFKHYLDAEIRKKENHLKELAGSSTNNRRRVELAKELDVLRVFQSRILPYVL